MEKRARSPNYPSISLKDAVEKVRTLHGTIGQTPHDRDVVARGMGYRSLSGASATAISALRKYGLLDGRSDEIHVSDRAMAILFAHSEEERAEALRAAALEPELFRDLAEKFPNRSMNDELLRNYLLRNKFSVQAVDGAISAYRDTLDYVGGIERGNDSGDKPAQEVSSVLPLATLRNPPRAPEDAAIRSPASTERPIGRYDFEGGGHVRIMVSPDIETEEALDMVETIVSLKRKELERKKREKNLAIERYDEEEGFNSEGEVS